MEECLNDQCPCKNYEPEYDKKFTSIGSKRLTKSMSHTASMGGSMTKIGSINDLKKLPYKITFKTKLEIFK